MNNNRRITLNTKKNIVVEFTDERIIPAGGLAVVGAIIQFIAGIVGTKNWNKPEKARKCITWGIIVIALCIFSNILTLVGYPDSFSVMSVITGLVIPVLYLIGGFQNKKLQG